MLKGNNFLVLLYLGKIFHIKIDTKYISSYMGSQTPMGVKMPTGRRVPYTHISDMSTLGPQGVLSPTVFSICVFVQMREK